MLKRIDAFFDAFYVFLVIAFGISVILAVTIAKNALWIAAIFKFFSL